MHVLSLPLGLALVGSVTALLPDTHKVVARQDTTILTPVINPSDDQGHDILIPADGAQYINPPPIPPTAGDERQKRRIARAFGDSTLNARQLTPLPPLLAPPANFPPLPEESLAPLPDAGIYRRQASDVKPVVGALGSDPSGLAGDEGPVPQPPVPSPSDFPDSPVGILPEVFPEVSLRRRQASGEPTPTVPVAGLKPSQARVLSAAVQSVSSQAQRVAGIQDSKPLGSALPGPKGPLKRLVRRQDEDPGIGEEPQLELPLGQEGEQTVAAVGQAADQATGAEDPAGGY